MFNELNVLFKLPTVPDVLAVNKAWFKTISGWASNALECDDFCGVQSRPSDCTDFCFVVFLGLMAASSGYTGFLPTTINHDYVEFPSMHQVRYTAHELMSVYPIVRSVGLRYFLNLRYIAEYFLVEPRYLWRCYVDSLPRLFGPNSFDLSQSFLCSLPTSTFMEFFVLRRWSAEDIIDYCCAHPRSDTDFINLLEVREKELVKIARILRDHSRQLMFIPSVAALSMQLTPIITYFQLVI